MKRIKLNSVLQPKTLLYVLFLGGFLFGMIVAFVCGNNESIKRLYWLEQVLMYLKFGEIQYGELLYFVLKKRLSVIAILVLFCISGKGKFLLSGGVVLAGGFFGYFITTFILIKGILGSLLFLVSVFPHYICYAYGYCCLLLYLFHGRRKDAIKTDRIGQNKYNDYNINRRKTVKKLLPFVVVIIGILLECYVNPFFLKIFVKIFM